MQGDNVVSRLAQVVNGTADALMCLVPTDPPILPSGALCFVACTLEALLPEGFLPRTPLLEIGADPQTDL
ncbi:hypothetical protein ACSRUE_45800 [Sorangium sp. KYC3313]|uniref:hypothetical protein n=1 Tax=Sorangium sp. KYC3313 TaxID=3449740 RepID=UPI003F8CAB60